MSEPKEPKCDRCSDTGIRGANDESFGVDLWYCQCEEGNKAREEDRLGEA